jgi:hypothetical protein
MFLMPLTGRSFIYGQVVFSLLLFLDLFSVNFFHYDLTLDLKSFRYDIICYFLTTLRDTKRKQKSR